MKHITIKDVAKKLNVSISSVSRAFNDKYDIKKETKELILKTAKEMGYHPNPIAKKLSQKKTFNIGVVVPEFINEYYSEIIIAIQELFIKNGYQVLFTQSDEKPEQELLNVKTLMQNMVDGLIIAPTSEDENMDFYLQQYRRGYPIVFMSRISEHLDASKVLFNNKKWSFFSAEHLVNQGFKKIYHLSGYKKSTVARDRITGFNRALEKYNFPKENTKLFECGIFVEEGIKIIDELYEKNDLPEAFFCANDQLALGVIKNLKEKGFKIPDDIAVTGFTETRMAELISPKLTSVKQPTYEMGRKAAELLLKNLNDENSPTETIILNGELNIRESSIKKRN
ncbi:MAG: LacI family DNA-binding transcriptional regulator [Polaribacter sp.]|nr:LacI family DNA-binding transcriptional regulator [Polaribacter sp.]